MIQVRLNFLIQVLYLPLYSVVSNHFPVLHDDSKTACDNGGDHTKDIFGGFLADKAGRDLVRLNQPFYLFASVET